LLQFHRVLLVFLDVGRKPAFLPVECRDSRMLRAIGATRQRFVDDVRHGARPAVRNEPRRVILQIVDNLHLAIDNRNVLKPTSPRAPRQRTVAPLEARPVAPRRAVAADHPIALIQAHSLPGLVQRELERMILAGDLAAGAKLREVEVAAMLGVSRGPVREAFRALEESGLVRLEKNRGVFVRQIGIDEADDIFEVRAVLDEFAGWRAAQNATPAEAAELRALVERMEKSVSRGDVDGYHDTNLAFHDRIVQLAGNPKLLTLYRRLVNELHLHRRAALGRAGILPVSIREHRAIVEHIAARQAAAAGRALFEHAMASRERVHQTPGTYDAAPKPRKVAR
jgi:phosphonate utilization transcriptional regulator